MPALVNDAAALPVLEPLSQATGDIIRPLNLYQNDFLLIDLDREGKRFICTPATLQRIGNEDTELPEGVPSTDIVTHAGLLWQIDRQRIPSSIARYSWAKRIPERRQSKDGMSWIVGATDFSALVLHHSWPHMKLVFLSDDARVMYLFLLRRFLDQNRSAILTADYKINRVVPEMPSDFIEHPEWPLMEHQKIGLLASLHREAYALFMEQGTGKTGTAIGRVCLEATRKRRGELPNRPGNKQMYRVLIICPNQVRMNWEREFETFATVPGKVSVMRGGEINRARNLVDGVRDEPDCAWSAVIMGFGSVPSMMQYLKRADWDLVIVDESHYVKSPQSQRSKLCRELRTFPLVRQCMVLTGTPIANTVMDLWAQFEMMAEGMSGFMTFANFRKFYGHFKPLGKNTSGKKAVEKLVGLKHAPLLQERLARTAFMLTKKEARLNLPDKMHDIVEVEMTPDQAKVYKTMADHLAVSIGGIDDKTMSADHILTQLLRLAQITSGHVKYDAKIDPVTLEKLGKGETEQIKGGNPKVEALVELLADEGKDPNGKTIVWACFVEDIRVISERLTAEGIGHRTYFGGTSEKAREQAVLDFNTDPEVKVFIANPETAKEGLNLIGYDYWNKEPTQSTYTDREVFFSQNWSMLARTQAEDRAHRKGTRQPVMITDLCIPGTIDEEIRARVLQKRETALMVQDVREIMSRVLSFNGDD